MPVTDAAAFPAAFSPGRYPLHAAATARAAFLPGAASAVLLDAAHKRAFAANAIALSPNRAWSAVGASAPSAVQCGQIERAGSALGVVELDEIEKAGGSLRCCVAEIF